MHSNIHFGGPEAIQSTNQASYSCCAQGTAAPGSHGAVPDGAEEGRASSKQSPNTARDSWPSSVTRLDRCSSFWCALMPMQRLRMVLTRSCAAAADCGCMWVHVYAIASYAGNVLSAHKHQRPATRHRPGMWVHVYAIASYAGNVLSAHKQQRPATRHRPVRPCRAHTAPWRCPPALPGSASARSACDQ